MKVTCKLLVAALMLGFSAGVRAQNSSDASSTPRAASQSHGADVLWDGKAFPGWDGMVADMKLLAPGVGWAEGGGSGYWTTDNGANWSDIRLPSSLISASQGTQGSESYEGSSD